MDDENNTLNQQRLIQQLRLDLQEKEELVAHLQAEIERLKVAQSSKLAEGIDSRMYRLMIDVSNAVVQIATQSHLVLMEGKEIPAKDILANAKRLVRVLEESGLKQEGNINEVVKFDPSIHYSIGQESMPKIGQHSSVRFVGLSYNNRAIRKIGVQNVSCE